MLENQTRRTNEVLVCLPLAGALGECVDPKLGEIVCDPAAKLRLLVVDLIGQTEWTGLSDDLKGDAYEGLLEKNARDTKSGAGQYFTPRPLIEAVVDDHEPAAAWRGRERRRRAAHCIRGQLEGYVARQASCWRRMITCDRQIRT